MKKKGVSLSDSIVNWIEYRLPIFGFIKHSADYRVPKNLNYAWNFGSMAGIALLMQIVTGLFLAMQYTPHVKMAFDCVENIMRNVIFGVVVSLCIFCLLVNHHLVGILIKKF